jgi:hypothetical protein
VAEIVLASLSCSLLATGEVKERATFGIASGVGWLLAAPPFDCRPRRLSHREGCRALAGRTGLTTGFMRVTFDHMQNKARRSRSAPVARSRWHAAHEEKDR